MTITIGTATCVPPANPAIPNTFMVDGQTYGCPEDFEIFCNSLLCQDFTDQTGFCVNGVTYTNIGCRTIDGCNLCSKTTAGTTTTTCNVCANGLTLSSNTCRTSSCSSIPGCTSCTLFESNATKCLACDTSNDWALSNNICQRTNPICTPIPGCQACRTVNSVLTCTNCGS